MGLMSHREPLLVKNLAQECREAFDNLSVPDPQKVRIAGLNREQTQRQFEKFCPAFGYRPISSQTHAHNLQNSVRVGKILRDLYPDTPSFPRTYDGSGRAPPLFSGY